MNGVGREFRPGIKGRLQHEVAAGHCKRAGQGDGHVGVCIGIVVEEHDGVAARLDGAHLAGQR